ncbi:MAG: zinc ribbon domain-containing protein [Saprospirales bacterium]|nr:zinc ribbon domain-containing protein [Saprospirales bacterium]
MKTVIMTTYLQKKNNNAINVITVLNIDDKFYENCGNFLIKNTKQEPLNITCNQCNNEVNQDDNFCENCGNKLK